MSRDIHVFLEGVDDERFFHRIIKPLLREKEFTVRPPYSFANRNRKELEKILRSLNKQHTEYIFLTDLDHCRCYTNKKEHITTRIASNVNQAKIIIVKTEIESWYLAGLDRSSSSYFNINFYENTEIITKSKFKENMPMYFEKDDFMIEILKRFSISQAKLRNPSFQYFCTRVSSL